MPLFKQKRDIKAPVFERKKAIGSIEKRLRGIEKLSSDIDKEIEHKDNHLKREFHASRHEIEMLKLEMEKTRKELKHIDFILQCLINKLKTSVKKEEFEAIKRRAELWKPETFITTREFERIAKENI